jgi:hypothetical protein
MSEPAWRRYARLLGVNPRADTDEELNFHLEMRVRDYMRRGMDEAEARRAAESRLGDLERVRRECEVEGVAVVRERRRSEWIAELRQDVRYGARSLLRAPSFTAMAVLTLAIGIGATTAIFSLVHSVLLAPLPYAEPDRIVRVWETSPQGETRNVVSAGNVHDWGERSRSITPLAAYAWSAGQTLTGAGDHERVTTGAHPACRVARPRHRTGARPRVPGCRRGRRRRCRHGEPRLLPGAIRRWRCAGRAHRAGWSGVHGHRGAGGRHRISR